MQLDIISLRYQCGTVTTLMCFEVPLWSQHLAPLIYHVHVELWEACVDTLVKYS